MKNLSLKSVILALIVVFLASCEPDKYVVNLPPQTGDTIIYYLDTSGVSNYTINEYHISIDGDCNIVGFFIDSDTNDFYTDQVDFELGQITVCPEESSPDISINEYINETGCTIWQIFINGEIFSEKTMCPDTFPADTIFIQDTVLIIDTVVIKGNNFIRECYYEGFNNSGNTSYYQSIGWDCGKGFKMDQVLYTYPEYNFDTAWSSQIFSEPMDVNYLDVFVGSQNDYLVSILLQDASGNIFVVDTLSTFSQSFSWEDITTYNHFNYESSIENLKFFDMVKVGIAKEGVFHPNHRNKKVNVDELFIKGIKQID